MTRRNAPTAASLAALLEDFEPLRRAERIVLRAAVHGDIARVGLRRPTEADDELTVRAALAEAWLLQDDLPQAAASLGRAPSLIREPIGDALLSMLWRLRVENQRWRLYPRMLVGENRWRAQRHGIDEGLVDFGKGEIVPFAKLLDELIALTAPDAERLGCAREIAMTRDILARGTSAHRQIAIHRQAVAAGAARADALNAVVDWLIAETIAGL